jgi:hypothetical protein
VAHRQNFGRGAKREIAKRAVNAIGVPCCENCGATGVPREFHHLEQDAMKTPEAKQRKLTAADGALWCVPCHRPESKKQAAVLAKVEAVEARHWLPRKPSTLRSRGFAPPAAKDRSLKKPLPDRRQMFEDA